MPKNGERTNLALTNFGEKPVKLIKRWKAELNIRDLITHEHLTKEQLKERSIKIGQRLRQFVDSQTKFFTNIPESEMEFKDITEAFEEGITDVNYFNEQLTNLWDVCDECRIWIPFVRDEK